MRAVRVRCGACGIASATECAGGRRATERRQGAWRELEERAAQCTRAQPCNAGEWAVVQMGGRGSVCPRGGMACGFATMDVLRRQRV